MVFGIESQLKLGLLKIAQELSLQGTLPGTDISYTDASFDDQLNSIDKCSGGWSDLARSNIEQIKRLKLNLGIVKAHNENLERQLKNERDFRKRD